jgi:hypothetical protein
LQGQRWRITSQPNLRNPTKATQKSGPDPRHVHSNA